MEKSELRILLIEDVATDAELEVRELKRAGLRVVHRIVETEGTFREALRDFQPELIISDFSMPHFDGMFALALARDLAPEVPFIFVSGTIGEEYAIRALRNGATDYVLKSNLVRLPAAVERALKDTAERTALRLAEQWRAGQNRIFEAIATGASLAEVLRLLALMVEAQAPEMMCSILLLDEDGTHLRDGAAPSLPAAYNHAVDGIAIGPSSGSCGTAAYRKERVVVTDIAADPLWADYRELAARHGLRACWSTPIISRGGKLLGTFANYFRLPRGPAAEELDLITAAANIARIAIEKSNDESEILRSKERLDLAMEASDVALWDHDVQSGRVYLSEHWAKLLGEKPRETVTTVPDLVQLAHPDDRQKLLQLAGEMLRGQRLDYEAEYRVMTATGEWRWILSRGKVVERTADGSTRRVIGTNMDITERRRVAEQVSLQAAALESAANSVVITDRAGTIVWVNPAFSRMTGYAADEAIGTKPDLLKSDRHDQSFYRNVWATLLSGDLWQGELVSRRKDGTFYHDAQTITPVQGSGGEITHFVAISEDVTQRIQQEEKIARLTRIHMVLSGINSAIVRIRDRQKLFEEACRIAVEHGKFGLAWVGRFNPTSLDVTPVAWAGLGSDEITSTKSTARDDVPQGQGLVGQAVRGRRLVFSNDISADTGVGGKRRQEALRLGYRSLIVLPLFEADAVTGIIALFAKEPNFYDDEEIKLLTELAGDVSFALEHIAGQERIEKLSRVRAVSSEINAAIVRMPDQEQLLRETCRIAVELGKFEMIWIGAVDSKKQEVRPLFWNGFSEAAARAVTWQSVQGAQGTLGEAMQTRRTSVRDDIEAQYGKGRLREEALKRGCLSNVCLPLLVDDSVVGLICLFAPGQGYFDKDELALIEEVASNVSFALEHIAGQKRIEKLSRVRAVSGEINAAIVRIRDREELFSEACRIAVEHGKFEMAWIGTLDEAAQEIKPVARAGREDGYLARIKLTIDPDTTRNLAMAVEAVARRAPVLCNDIANDGRMRPWRAAALERGYHSSALLPLVLEQQAVGVFALYAGETGFFDEEEMKLLAEIAGDISFALDNIKKGEKLDYLAYYDAVTGLPNRALFNDRLDQQVAAAHSEQKGCSVMMLDLERFRHINDTLGRQAGDHLLRQIAGRLNKVLGETDILAHIGGDYFTIATRHVGAGEDVARWLDRILTAVSGQAYRLNGDEIRIAARAGIALYPADGAGADALLKNAEAALKSAKKTGQHYQFYAPQMNARVAEHLKLENDLRRAILEDQFILYYQPRMEFAGGHIGGLEALLRWQHPERGMVPPGEFIALLESTGLILEVGRWALRRAAQDHAAWRAMGAKPPRIAVNVSAVQLQRKDFVEDFKAVMAEAGDSRKFMDIEITESMLMEDLEGNIEKLKAVREMGVEVAMDDFGTGYSSLSYLARLPISSLKIDRSFVTQMVRSPEQMAIVSTVISLARALNLKVVAEGVETEEQANLLRLLRCDEAQGYLYAKPMPPKDIEAMLLKA